LTNAADFRELTTLRVGGAIADFREPSTRGELIDTFREVSSSRQPWFLLGGGSNIVVSDEPFSATVIRVATRGIDRHDDGERALVTAQAGESWDALVSWSVDNGLSGLEALSGIPGTVGAAPIQNIGAYGVELSDTFESLQFLPAGQSEVVTLRSDALSFGYRRSSLQTGLTGLVISVTFALTPGTESAPIRFDQLARALDVPLGSSVALAEVRRSVLELRASKGMVVSDDPDSVSVGSFFTNPVVPASIARALPPGAPRFPLEPQRSETAVPLGVTPEFPDFASAPGDVKLSAAWLIENAGIPRGFAVAGSNAAISSKHTLAIINRGGATANEVLELARYITIRVHDAFGVVLEPEPTMIGFD
jgi:UDP-N-acetylmuramate dehydrogenase